jgi:tetratricopeptide (TPR) repeat protein
MNDALTEVARDVDRYSERRQFPRQAFPLESPPVVAAEAQGCLDPEQAAYELGMASTSINPAFARNAFDWLIERRSDDPRAYVGYSVIEREGGDFEEAFRAARYALRLDRGNIRARVEMATTMVEACREDLDPRCRRQWQNAAAIYAAVLEEEPDRIDAAFGLGVAQVLLGRPGEAIGVLQRAHEQAPWAPRISLFLGEAYRLSGQAERAGWHLSRAARWEVEPEWQDKAKRAIRLLPSAGG